MHNFDLVDLFGEPVTSEPLVSPDRMGRRLHGVDLSRPLTSAQASGLQDLLDEHQVISFPGQDQHTFDVHDLERLANYFGAPIPHPSNYRNYGAPAHELELRPVDQQAVARIDAAFDGVVTCVRGADTAATYPVNNLADSGPDAEPVHGGGQHWHTDIEFEPIPLSTSMFYVQCAPATRNAPGGTWVTNPPREPGFYHPDSPPRLAELREALPLNGETAYTDTAAAYRALPQDTRHELDSVMVRRRLRTSDEGWLVPLVYTNPRTGSKSLHSPVWASRGKRVAPAQVEGLTDDESRAYLDVLEEHVLQPEFRYDHPHVAGDVTIWSNFSTLHVAPPTMKVINDPADARLMYRISCKGDPCFELPRTDTDAWINDNIVPPYRTPGLASMTS